MGYTNYWYQYRDFTDSEWVEIVDYFNTLMEKEELNVQKRLYL